MDDPFSEETTDFVPLDEDQDFAQGDDFEQFDPTIKQAIEESLTTTSETTPTPSYSFKEEPEDFHEGDYFDNEGKGDDEEEDKDDDSDEDWCADEDIKKGPKRDKNMRATKSKLAQRPRVVPQKVSKVVSKSLQKVKGVEDKGDKWDNESSKPKEDSSLVKRKHQWIKGIFEIFQIFSNKHWCCRACLYTNKDKGIAMDHLKKVHISKLKPLVKASLSNSKGSAKDVNEKCKRQKIKNLQSRLKPLPNQVQTPSLDIDAMELSLIHI